MAHMPCVICAWCKISTLHLVPEPGCFFFFFFRFSAHIKQALLLASSDDLLSLKRAIFLPPPFLCLACWPTRPWPNNANMCSTWSPSVLLFSINRLNQNKTIIGACWVTANWLDLLTHHADKWSLYSSMVSVCLCVRRKTKTSYNAAWGLHGGSLNSLDLFFSYSDYYSKVRPSPKPC